MGVIDGATLDFFAGDFKVTYACLLLAHSPSAHAQDIS